MAPITVILKINILEVDLDRFKVLINREELIGYVRKDNYVNNGCFYSGENISYKTITKDSRWFVDIVNRLISEYLKKYGALCGFELINGVYLSEYIFLIIYAN